MEKVREIVPRFLLSTWDERKGPKIIAELLPGIAEDAIVLATQSYITSQNVFNNVEFSRIFFTLPNLKIGRNVKYYFDILPDENVRGGQRPFLLAVFLPLDAPDVAFAYIDPIMERVLDQYKNGTVPDFSLVQSDVKQVLGDHTDTTTGQIAVDVEVGEQAGTHVVTINCEICKDLISFNLDANDPNIEKASIGEDLTAYTYTHGTPGEEHRVKVTVDQDHALTKVEYVDDAGERISPFQESEVPLGRVGTWSADEIKSLEAEMHKGTPDRTIARMLQRATSDVELKKRELEKDNLEKFNRILATAIADAKKSEAASPVKAQQKWLKVAEYCVEFATKTPGLSWDTAHMIKKKARSIIARAEKLVD